MEEKDRRFFNENPDYILPYPHLDDSQFQKRITVKKEFQYRYDGEIDDVSKKSEMFVKKEIVNYFLIKNLLKDLYQMIHHTMEYFCIMD